jgi:hypothetical protein
MREWLRQKRWRNRYQIKYSNLPSLKWEKRLNLEINNESKIAPFQNKLLKSAIRLPMPRELDVKKARANSTSKINPKKYNGTGKTNIILIFYVHLPAGKIELQLKRFGYTFLLNGAN